MKKSSIFITLLIIWSCCYATDHYLFSAVSPSGHTLYYDICGGNARVTYPFVHTNSGGYWGNYPKPTGNVIIPAIVSYNGVNYAVTSIDEYTFVGCTNISSIVIPNNVSLICQYAFMNCTGITSIICLGNTPPQMQNGNVPFSGISIYGAIVKVPCGTSSAYSTAQGWSYFSNFEEYIISPNYTITALSQDTNKGTATTICTGVEAMAKHGYVFNHWQDGNTDNPRTITTLTSNKTYTAYFTKDIFHITTSYTGNGGYVIGDTNAEYLSTVTISAVPNERYRFLQWQDGDTNNPRTIVVTDTATYTPTFVGEQYHVTVRTIGGDSTCLASVSSSYYGGTDTMMTMIYDGSPVCYLNAYINPTPSGYQFKRWMDGSTINPRQIVSMSGNLASNNTNVLSDTVFYAEFERRPITISTNVGSGTTIGTTGWTSGDTTVLYGDSVTLTATPNSHWHFQNWHSPQTGQTYYDNPLTIVATSNATYRAFFNIDNHIVTCLTDGGGTALNDNDISGQRHYQAEWNYNQQVQIYATPNDGNRFVMWNDSNVFATRIITVLCDTTFTAYFAPIESLRDTIILYLHDTIHDTIYITQEGIDGADAINAKVYSSQGQIVVEGAEGNTVTLFDINGRMLATKRDYGTEIRFDAPASGTYMIKIGDLPARRVVVIR